MLHRNRAAHTGENLLIYNILCFNLQEEYKLKYTVVIIDFVLKYTVVYNRLYARYNKLKYTVVYNRFYAAI